MFPITPQSTHKLILLGDLSVGKTSILNRLMLNKFEPRYTSTHKLILLGDLPVGKTNILNRLMLNKFKPTNTPTRGIDFQSRYFEDRRIRLHIWDAAGQERFQGLTPSLVRASSAAIIVYDVSDRESFINTSRWIEDVHNTERESNAIIVLVGNKTDLVDKRQVSRDEGETKARECGAMYIETSAKADFNMKEKFHKITASLSGTETSTSANNDHVVDLNLRSVDTITNGSQESSGGCCC